MRKLGTALWIAATLLAAVATQTGCEDKSKSSPSPESSASAAPATDMAIDPNVTKALAATSATAAEAPGDGPPATGVFGPGGADKVHARGAPVEVKLGSDGSAPRVAVGSPAPFKGNATLTVAIQMGPRNALPTVDFGLEFVPEKADKAAAGAPAIVVKIKKADLSSEQLGQVPAAAAKEIGKLKGSELRIVRGPDGAASDLTLQMAKDAAPDLERMLATLGDAIMAFEVPPPPKPVGVGAVWIAQTRNAYTGIDVVSYRMYKVTEIKGDDVTISVEVKQYAAGPNMTFAGLPPTAQLAQFESLGDGELTVRKGESFPKDGKFAQQLSIGMPGQGQNANRVMMLQLQSNVLLSR